MTNVIFYTSINQQLATVDHYSLTMQDTRKAISEVLGFTMGKAAAKKYFYNVYEYMLYNDTNSFLETLDFKMTLTENCKLRESYKVFRFMLGLLNDKNPSKLLSLCPNEECKK